MATINDMSVIYHIDYFSSCGPGYMDVIHSPLSRVFRARQFLLSIISPCLFFFCIFVLYFFLVLKKPFFLFFSFYFDFRSFSFFCLFYFLFRSYLYWIADFICWLWEENLQISSASFKNFVEADFKLLWPFSVFLSFTFLCKCKANCIMIWVVWAVPVNIRFGPCVSWIFPVGLINVSSTYMSCLLNQLSEPMVFQPLD